MFAKAWVFVAALGVIGSPRMAERPAAQRQPDRAATFVPEEATISGTHAALAAGDVTCVQVVQAYLRRIEAYDDRGPALNALISINPAALETAAEMTSSLRAARSTRRSRPISMPNGGWSTASMTPSTKLDCCADTICARRS